MIKPRARRKLPECVRCLLYSHNPFLLCAVHPGGPKGDSCLDFRLDPDLENRRFEDFLGLESIAGHEMEESEIPFENLFDLDSDEEQWELEEGRFVNGEMSIESERSFYNGEEIIQPRQRWTREEQPELLDWHPLFTGKCPQCNLPFPRYEKTPVHWDCPCGWVDDTV